MTRITLLLAAGTLLTAAIVGLAQPGAPPPPATPPAKVAADPPAAKAPANRFPVWATAKAFVSRDGDKGIKMRAELPLGRFLKLTDADGKEAHVYEFAPHQPPPFSVDLTDIRVFDTRGRARKTADWADGLKDETLVLMEFRESGDADGAQLAEAYRLYREDLAVLILPSAVMKRVDTSKAFSPAKSLPQTFPGAPPTPGGPVAPKKGPGR